MPAAQKSSIWKQIRGLSANFWFANIMEMFERLAFFGVRAIAPLFLVASANENGLGLSYKEKGVIYTVWALLQCLIPMVSGGYTDRYGYRKSLAVAFVINVLGYLLMAQSKPLADSFAASGWAGGGFWVFMLAACFVATGTAIFKPPVQGTIARATTDETSSVGWGLFYWVVNIGGALAPMGAAILRADIDWQLVFYAAAAVTAFNFIPAFVLYREPERVPPAEGEEDKPRGPLDVLVSSVTNIAKDARLCIFLLIFSCFWLMFMQLWDLLPNFIDEWVQSRDVAGFFGWFSSGWLLADGQVKPEIIINIDSISIILLVIPLSYLISRLHKVAAMIIGMVIALFGFVGAGATSIGLVCCIMVFIFSIGEMACSPTFSAYIGLIAPKDKKALYMGYSNIPFAIGWALGNLVGGFFYDDYGARATLALKHLAAHVELVDQAAPATDWSDSLEKLPPLLRIQRDQAFEIVARENFGGDTAAAASYLRDSFRWDRGQVASLALVHMACEPVDHDDVAKGLVEALTKQAEEPAVSEYVVHLATLLGPATSAPATSAPATNASDPLPAVSQALTKGDLKLDAIGLARVVQLLPGIVGKTRDSAVSDLRKELNADRPEGQVLEQADVVRQLWDELGDDPAVLDNLALEYLAQASGELQTVLANLQYESKDGDIKGRVEELTERLGLDQGKAFYALGVAMGCDAAEVQRRLDDEALASVPEEDRPLVWLVMQPKWRAVATASAKWQDNLGLLRDLIQDDQTAREIVAAEIDRESWLARALAGLRRLTGSATARTLVVDGINYTRLAANRDLIDKALTAKDWSQRPDDAARFLQLSRFEARALVRADIDRARQTLWDEHQPYMVWVYLGLFGLGGTVGMIIFYFVIRRGISGGAETTAA